jgi:C-terminal processing protease CtpA/Prc
MDATIESLPMNAFLLYPMGQPRTPKGALIDGRGVRPDIEVSLSRDGLLAGRDAQLEAAVEYIKKQTRR